VSPRCPVELLKDTELYQLLLGLPSPWTVDRVEVHLKDGRVDVFATHPKGTEWTCPKCGRLLTTFDHTEERVWRHLDSLQFKTYLHARPPRVDCPADGRVQVAIPWAETYSRFAAQFEIKAIDTLLETPVEGATKIMDMSWDEAWNIKERAVERGLEVKARAPPKVRLMGVDEKAVGLGQTYATLVYDLERSTVEYVGEDRKKESLDAYFGGLTPEQLTAIEGVALDMWEPFVLLLFDK
jgi:transposase